MKEKNIVQDGRITKSKIRSHWLVEIDFSHYDVYPSVLLSFHFDKTNKKKRRLFYRLFTIFLTSFYTKKTAYTVNEYHIEKEKSISYGPIYLFKCSSFSCLFIHWHMDYLLCK